MTSCAPRPKEREKPHGHRRGSDSSSDAKPVARSILRARKSEAHKTGDEREHSDSEHTHRRTVTLKIPSRIHSPAQRPASKVFSETCHKLDASDSEESLTSLDEDDLAQLGDWEDDLDIERLESQVLIFDVEEGDDNNDDDDDDGGDQPQPFAYALDNDSDRSSNFEECWMKELDLLDTGTVMLENNSIRPLQPLREHSNEAKLEAEFFKTHLSSGDLGHNDHNPFDNDYEDYDDHDDGDSSGADDDMTSLADDDMGEIIQWDYLITAKRSDSDDSNSDSDGESSSTDVESPSVILARHKAASLAPITPAKPAVKTNLTSCLKQTVVLNNDSPSTKVESTPIKMNTSHNPPMLGTWQRDTRGTAGIIDGITTHSPVGPIFSQRRNKATKKESNAVGSSGDLAAEAITSLDDIMHTNDLVEPEVKEVPTKYNRPIHVGAFRRGQMRNTLLREDSLKDEFYNIAARHKERTGRTRPTPVLGSALSRKDRRIRKKWRAAANTDKSESSMIDPFSGLPNDNEPDDGVERAGLGFGPPVESLFVIHEYA